MKLGQRRADKVKAALLKLGVPVAKILSSTSVGETKPISTSAADMFLDRSVEINP